VFLLRKQIHLVCILFTEAGKAIATMPFLLFQPILVSFDMSFDKS